MKHLLPVILICLVYYSAAQVVAKPHQATAAQKINQQDTAPKHVVTGRDIPANDTRSERMKTLKYIGKSNSKYAQIVGRVYTPTITLYPSGEQQVPVADAATYEDSVLLAAEIEKLLLVIRNNYTQAIDNYVDTLEEISRIKNLHWTSNNRVYKRDINGIKYNISLLQNVFNRGDFDAEDLELISYIFHNNDSLINVIDRNVKGFQTYSYQVSTKPINFTLLDTLQNEVTAATCFFIRKSSWRDLANCQECPANPLKIVCPDTILGELEQVPMIRKFFYNKTNPDSKVFPLTFGSYHLLVLVGDKIRFHETLAVDMNSPNPTLTLLYGR